MGLSVEEVRNKLDFYCGKWAVMAFNAFIEDLSDTVWKYTLEWPYGDDSLIITIGDVRTLWLYFVPICIGGCTTEKEILRARDAWKEFELNMEEKSMEQRCDNCRYFKLDVMEEPCVKCTLNGGVWSKWEPKEDKKMVEDLFEYAKRDVEAARDAWSKYFTINPSNKPAVPKMPGIEDVIFNGPATIVKWMDGTKTVVKAQKGKNGKTEKLDPEKGLAMAICKKVYGNDGRYYDIFKHYCE